MYTVTPSPEETIFFRGGGVFTQATKVHPELIFCNHFLPFFQEDLFLRHIG